MCCQPWAKLVSYPPWCGWFGFHVLIDVLDLECAILQHCGDRRDGCNDWRDDGADDAGGERKFCDRPAVVFDYDAPHVAFVNDRLELLGDRVCVAFNRFPGAAIVRFLSVVAEDECGCDGRGNEHENP